jgi:protein-S-isoprenylcysteine O-methyltransferase Ste14
MNGGGKDRTPPQRGASWLVLVATFLLWLVLHCIVIPREERGLESRHKEDYRQYVREVRRWF